MFRKLIAVTLFVSFIAISTSGLLMFFIEKPSFTIQMHPVHKLFGLIMIIAVICHLSYHLKSIISYVKDRTIALFGGVMVCILVLVYGVAIQNKIPLEIAIPMDELADKAESHE